MVALVQIPSLLAMALTRSCFVLEMGAALADAIPSPDLRRWGDVLGMDSLGFSDFGISEGTGANASHTILTNANTGNYLSILQNITASNITADFMCQHLQVR